MGPGRNFEDKLDRQKKKKKTQKSSFVECCSVSCCEKCVMPACESKLVSRSSRKATVAKTVLIGYRPRSYDHMPSLVGDCGLVLRVLG